jgi:hypothetical protein
MSVGETVLRTAPITPELPLSIYQDTVPTFDGESLPQVQQQQLTAVPQLLCTGEVEDVRGDAGTFPQSLAPLEVDGDIYHPRGTFTGRQGCGIVRDIVESAGQAEQQAYLR